MKKLISIVMMLFILTTLVPGANAAPNKSNTKYTTGSISGYSNMYATPNSEKGNSALTSTAYIYTGFVNQPSFYAATTVSAAADGSTGGYVGAIGGYSGPGDAFAIGDTQSNVNGGPGTYVSSGQTITGTINTGPINP